MMANYLGGSDMTVFKSKAGAMSFAILMNTTINSEGHRVVDYDETQKMFDFICASVNLPDVERDAMADMVEMLSAAVKELQKEKS